MRKFEPEYEPYYLAEEEIGIICAALRCFQETPYIDEHTWEKAELLIEYFCEGE